MFVNNCIVNRDFGTLQVFRCACKTAQLHAYYSESQLK